VKCVLDVNCDASQVTCDEERPRCNAGFVPVVTDDGTRWKHTCVARSECGNAPLNNTDAEHVGIPVDRMVDQIPIPFRVRNTTEEMLFMPGDYMQPAIALSYTAGPGSQYEKYRLAAPFCTLECNELDSIGQGMGMCVECSMAPPNLEVLAPGVEYTNSWSGQSFTTDATVFYCDCDNTFANVLPGTVTAMRSGCPDGGTGSAL
jgi:hypothetical protein